jgi:hypothetical protein
MTTKLSCIVYLESALAEVLRYIKTLIYVTLFIFSQIGKYLTYNKYVLLIVNPMALNNDIIICLTYSQSNGFK